MSGRAGASGPAFWGDAEGPEALRRYRSLVNVIDDGIYQLDAEGRFAAVNDAVVELTGYARDDLLGEHVSLLLADDDSTTEQFLTSPTDPSERIEFVVQTAEGGRVRCEARVTPFEADGAGGGTVGVVREVTDRGRPNQSRGESHRRRNREQRGECERESPETETRLEAAASAGLVGTWTWDIRENVVTADECLVASFDADPATATGGAPIEEFLASVHDADRERVRERLDEAVEETGEFATEYRITNADGDTRWVSSRGEVEYDDDGEVVRILGATADVTERKEAEAELERVTAETEEQMRLYETIVSSTPDLVYAFDLDYHFTFANDAVLEMWDRTLEESIGKTLEEIGYEPWHAEMHEREIDEVIETKEPVRGEVEFPHAELGRRVYDYIFAPVLDDDGEVEAIAGTTRDVTERKEAEEELQKSKERFRALVTASSDVVYRMSPDWSEMHELEGKEFLADTDESTSNWLDKYIHPDEQPRVREAIDEAIRTKGIFELEHRVERDDGNVGWTFSRAVPMLDEDGEIEEWIGMASDITERKRRERALEESERRYRTLTENFPNGAVGVYDHELRYTLAEGKVLGETLPSADRLEGNRMPDIFPSETVEDLEPVFRAAVEDGETGKTTTEFGGRDWRVWAAPLRDADGDIFAGLSLAQDVTEQVERERELEERTERLDRFASMLAHELRNPVTIGQIYSQQLPDDAGTDAVEYVTEAFDRIEDMIDVMLVLTRGRKAVGERTPVELADAARKTWDDVDAPEATLEVSVGQTIQADETYVQHLFRNLLENAVEHGGSDVTITVGDLPPGPETEADGDSTDESVGVSSERSEDEARQGAKQTAGGFYVADDGSGIPAENRDTVFEAGYTTTSGQEGTGLGLAFVSELAEVYGWEYEVTESAGGGARFEFTDIDSDP
ncbi:PAS domain S-box protein [Halorussus gelatinilyticus]|uniref:histidine kinase n=1 Tax=Halorussus gelatinilyticus TaxID=2937524 RepID=A0A8U0INE2_9EURY|nr:PAS domain-containing sensor histidine kinase [Halorussus gelatinilyticus]UPW02145.1 PAS domain S-box protein [Halorussus gelatinilyticus]